MQYAHIESGTIEKLGARPDWRYDNGEPVTDETLAENGWLRVVYAPPAHDALSQSVQLAPRSEWVIKEARVVATYILSDIPFDELKATALERINAEYSDRTSVIARGYPDYERESWPIQIEEANALLASEDADTPWIDAAAASRGIARLDLAQRIKANDVAYRRIHGALSGIRQALETQVMAVPDDEHAAETFAAIQWPPDQATDPT
jgi:hypothetical protein